MAQSPLHDFGQARLFPVAELEPWPRHVAIPLTLLVWLMPAILTLLAAVISGYWAPFFGAAIGSAPWAWAATKLSRFMITGEDDWELPYRRNPKKLQLVDGDNKLR
jgi:hypothetical protein